MTDDLVIPRWFLRLMSCVLGLAVPWAGWVTLQLATIEVKVEQAAELHDQSQAHLDGRIELVERRVEAMESVLRDAASR